MITKKIFSLILFILTISTGVFAQVGINTNDPKATLHVVGKPADNTVIDGIIAPVLTGDLLKAKDALYGADQIGAVVYVITPVTAASTKTAKVTAEGYYYFDSSLVWQPLKSVSSGGEGTVYYADNGLTMGSGNTVELGGALKQATNISGTQTLTISAPLAITSGVPGAGKVLTSDAAGNVSWQNVLPDGNSATGDTILVWRNNHWIAANPADMFAPVSTFVETPVEETGNFTVTSEDFVKLNPSSTGDVLTLPSAPTVKPGKIVWVSNIGKYNVDLSPHPRNTSFTAIQAGMTGGLIYLGGTGDGSWDWLTGF